jgi:Family of unknown function (DUF5908)
MPIEIREIVTEVVIRGPDEPAPAATAAPPAEARFAEAQAEALVRQAVERVLDVLRREWER